MKHLHEKRGITFQELGALLGTRALLVSKLVEHGSRSADPPEHGHMFNMSIACAKNGCGTVTCIGGTMALILGVIPAFYVGNVDGRSSQFSKGTMLRSQPLHDLFYPTEGDMLTPWADITVTQSIKAIDNWLATGKPGWKSVLAIKPKKYPNYKAPIKPKKYPNYKAPTKKAKHKK